MQFQEKLISYGNERLKSYGYGKNAPYISWYLNLTKIYNNYIIIHQLNTFPNY